MTFEFWMLTIRLTSGSWKICGSEEILRSAYNEIVEAMTQPEGSTLTRAVTIEGFTDTADRAPESLTVLIEKVEAVDLLQMSS